MTTVTCAACRRSFTGVHAYAAHQTPEYAPSQKFCLAPVDMAVAGLSLNAAGAWTIERASLADDATRTDRASCAVPTRLIEATP
jgi:hypothetical protein